MIAAEPWLAAHSYLRPVADLSAEVEGAAAGIETLGATIPEWEDYQADFLAGVPLLSSAKLARTADARWWRRRVAIGKGAYSRAYAAPRRRGP